MINDSQKPLIVFGDSSAEVFDYIFGKNPNYYPFWASGWNIRFMNESKFNPYLSVLKNMPLNTNILLHFGMTDIEFTLPILTRDTGFFDLPLFLKQMVEKLLFTYKYLKEQLGFNNIYPIFTALPTFLPNSFWIERFKFEPFPLKIRGQMMLDFAYEIEKEKSIESINCLHRLIASKKNPICHIDYTRVRPDHHIGFIEAQDIIYDELLKIDGMLPRRTPKHTVYYPHKNISFLQVVETNVPRENTCR